MERIRSISPLSAGVRFAALLVLLGAVGVHVSARATAAPQSETVDDTALLLVLHANEAGRLVAPLPAPASAEQR